MRYLIFSIAIALMFGASGAKAQSNPDRMPISPAPAVNPELEQAMNFGPKGQIAVRAVQGTKGGPAIGAADVEVELYHRNQGIKRISARLDEHGVVVIQDVPLGLSVRPVVRVRYANATYQDVGPQMDASRTSASVDVTVYEMTDEEPAWRVINRTLAIAPLPGELDVVETMEVENAGDRTWMGAPADAEGRRATVSMTLPSGARNVGLEFGFHGWCCTSVKDGQLIVQMPLMPGKSPFRFTYRVDAPSGSADVRVATRAPCAQVEYLIPDGSARVELSGLVDNGTRMVGQTMVRVYQSAALKPSTPVGIVLTGLPIATKPATTTARTEPAKTSGSRLDGSMPLIITIGVGVVILGGAVWLYVRPPAGKRKF